MVVFLLVMGAILGASAINGTIPQLGKQANDDLFGTGGKVGFLEWMAAILVIAVAAKSIDLPDAGKALLVLTVLVFLISDKGLLNQIASQITSGWRKWRGSLGAGDEPGRWVHWRHAGKSIRLDRRKSGGCWRWRAGQRHEPGFGRRCPGRTVSVDDRAADGDRGLKMFKGFAHGADEVFVGVISLAIVAALFGAGKGPQFITSAGNALVKLIGVVHAPVSGKESTAYEIARDAATEGFKRGVQTRKQLEQEARMARVERNINLAATI
jgi:hypothetical protein